MKTRHTVIKKSNTRPIKHGLLQTKLKCPRAKMPLIGIGLKLVGGLEDCCLVTITLAGRPSGPYKALVSGLKDVINPLVTT